MRRSGSRRARCRDFDSPNFDFDSLELGATTRQTLQRLAGCLVSGSLAGRKVLPTVHCDPRGENEYNMGLGAQRAESARDFLLAQGVFGAAGAHLVTRQARCGGHPGEQLGEGSPLDIEVR